ncbi:hypothetical protein F0919_18035 [Taibaiella lutea]|uniref:Uncharacterized protein n=1 Tax=Taibaiella lutea TaxID=2608001 RepID=A0A5M6CC97_9BACT|nr:hypothetical protein [Taibaiella lutea]KAA5532681.1 hypothetical protein F0919_18035 [Taibaiella lutea]
MRIEIHHPNGHVTNVPISLSDNPNVIERLEEDELVLLKIMDGIGPHLMEGTKVYLIIKSKSDNEY